MSKDKKFGPNFPIRNIIFLLLITAITYNGISNPAWRNNALFVVLSALIIYVIFLVVTKLKNKNSHD